MLGVTRWCGVAAVGAMLASEAQLGAQQAAPRTWRVTEEWRVDGSENGEPFGDVRDLVVTRDGAAWVLDFKDQKIRRFSAAGKPLPTAGRSGSGPGELRNANGMVLHGDGSVWVNDPSNSRLTVFGADGKYLRQHIVPITGFVYRWEGVYDSASGDVLDPALLKQNATFAFLLRRVKPSGTVGEVLPRPSCHNGGTPSAGWEAETAGKGVSRGLYPFTSGGGLALDGRGGAWCATPNSRQVALVRFGQNDTIARTTLALPPVAVSKAERDSIIALFRTRLATYATSTFDPAKVPTSKPGIEALHVDDDGRLWVQHPAAYGSVSTVFDVHDARGAHLGRVTVPYASMTGLPVRARGAAVWMAVRDADEVVSVVRFAIAR